MKTAVWMFFLVFARPGTAEAGSVVFSGTAPVVLEQLSALSTQVVRAGLTLRPEPDRPADFDAFWKRTRRELSGEPLDARLEAAPGESDAAVRCFRADYASLGGRRAKAWYCRPGGRGPFPGLLISPWYGEGAIDPPRDIARRGFAVLWYQARGFEVDRGTYPSENSYYIKEGLDGEQTYVYRGIIAHAWRGLDFLAGRPEVDRRRLGVAGASQGGGISLILAGLDKRVAAVSANFPFLSDFGDSLALGGALYRELSEEASRRPQVRRVLSYFDALNVAERVRAPALIEVGLKDEVCPAAGVVGVYNRLAGRRALRVFPEAGHGDEGAARWDAMLDFVARELRARPL